MAKLGPRGKAGEKAKVGGVSWMSRRRLCCESCLGKEGTDSMYEHIDYFTSKNSKYGLDKQNWGI